MLCASPRALCFFVSCVRSFRSVALKGEGVNTSNYFELATRWYCSAILHVIHPAFQVYLTLVAGGAFLLAALWLDVSAPCNVAGSLEQTRCCLAYGTLAQYLTFASVTRPHQLVDAAASVGAEFCSPLFVLLRKFLYCTEA